ncbi:MAG: DNA topoisomerase VI subunit B [Acidobacteria bacterium]|nr:MAG: DNA topoisomerase VI subunit B [Acidobacteriota bacterium]
MAKAAAQKKPAVGRGRKPARPQLALFEDDAGKVVKMPATAALPPVAPTPLPAPAPPREPTRRVTAETLAQKQREISVSEFFVKNRHLLGFDNPSKALLTTIKEAVDNSLDACEEAGILPELYVEVHDLGLEAKPRDAELTKGEGRFRIVVQDNGPGIVKAQVPKIFGKLLYGSKFHRLKQSLTADQNVLIERGGRLERLPIGRLIDSLLTPDEEVKDVSALGIRAPAFDPFTWRYDWRIVSHVIRHRRVNEVLEVRTERGKRVRVTGCHSLFTYDPGLRQVAEVEARSLRAGDYIVAPRRLPEPVHLDNVNLLSHLRADDLAPRWVFVYGIPEAVFDALAARFTTAHRKLGTDKSRRFFRLAASDGTPIEVLDDSWFQYRRQRFLPALLVKRLGLEAECAGGRLRTYHHGAVGETPVTWVVSEALMRLLGLYVAEGHCDVRQVGFTFSSRETNLVEEVVATTRALGLSTTVEPRTRNAVRVKVFGGLTSLLFPAWCGRGAKNKKVPAFVFQADRDMRQHFLDGLYLGDGHRVKTREVLIFGSASRRLVEDVEVLWLLQGVVPSRCGPIRHRGLGRNLSTSWRLNVHGFDIGVSHVYQRRHVQGRQNRYRLFPTRKLALAGVEAGVRVAAEPESIMRAAGLGTGPAGTEKSVGIVMGAAVGTTYGLPQLSALASGRVTRHLTNHIVERGYLLEVEPGGYAATPKVQHLRHDAAAVRSFGASDLCLLRVNQVRRVHGDHVFVYDLSIPGCENFVAGDGAIACHNSRGQQGIGISAAAMYGQLTTGKPIRVTSRVGRRKAAHVFDIQLDTRKNEPVVTHDEALDDWHLDHGTRVELEIVANWQQGQRFVNRYVEHTALANPHATIHYTRPVSAAQRSDPNVDQPGNEMLTFPRAADELPKEAMEIKPHPHGVELGALMLMARESKSHDVRGFLQTTFSRVSAGTAGEILGKVAWGKRVVRPRALGASRAMAEELHKAIAETRLMNPPTNCLSPIGDELMRKGLVSFLNVIESEGESADESAQLDLDSAAMKPAKKAGKAPAAGKQAGKAPPAPEQPTIPDAPPEEGVEKIKGHNYFIATVTRSPKVYRGNPFQVEVGLAYGGSWPPDKTIELFRFANRVPLLFQRGACGITDAIVRTDWRNYLLSQPKGSLPVGPMALLVHIASVWVPFTSESKEAVAHYPEIIKEIQLAAQECGRKLAAFIRKRKAADYQAQRRSIFELYIEEVAIAIGRITGRKPDRIKREFLDVAHKVTAAEMKEEEKAMELEAREAKAKAKASAEAEEAEES